MTPGEHSGPNGNPARFPSRPERPARLPGGRKAHRNPQGAPQPARRTAIRNPQPAPRAPKSMRPGHPEAAFAREAKAPPAIETIETLKPETLKPEPPGAAACRSAQKRNFRWR